MSASSHGGPGLPSNRENDAVGEDPTVSSTSGGDLALVSLCGDDKSVVETRFLDDINESRALKLEIVDSASGDTSEGGNQPNSLISRGLNSYLKEIDVGNVTSEHKKIKSSAGDYDSILSEFDRFASKGGSEAVGYGYEIGDMVWGKVKSHPWWPGQIYNEAFASPSVQRSKREGHVLVAFFGDGSYGWFEPSELVPFEENFADKSRQTSSRTFLKAVEESLDEVSRRWSLGLICRCRNRFNFWPSSVKGYFVVDVGDSEPVAYSMSQIDKARESFHPIEMLNFVQQLALTPMLHQHWTIEFVKNKATVLACRKALFEEFDETYAQAFGTVPVRPPRPTAPVVVDPLKAPLSGRLVFAEGKQKFPSKPTKSRDQLEKDRYLFKRRDEASHTKTKKTSSGQVGGPALPHLVDGTDLSGVHSDSAVKGHVHQNSVSDINNDQHQPINQASVISDIKPSQGSKKLVEAENKKAKLQKLSAENASLVSKKKRKKEITTENVILVKKTKKRKKEIRSEASVDMAKFHRANSNRVTAAEKVSGLLPDAPLGAATNQLDNQKNNVLVAFSSSSEAKPAVDLGKVELPVLVNDLRALAVDPFHGVERSCQDTVDLVFLKYRSLVYQKSWVSSPETEIETSEAVPGPSENANEKLTVKPLKPLVRPDDPTKGGKKRLPSDRLEPTKKKKKLDESEEINRRKKLEGMKNRKKPVDSEDVKMKKKKILDYSKLLSVEKKILRPTESPAVPKVVKVESSKRPEQPGKARDPTMLVMKFPAGAALPSGAHLRAKFVRFGPLDHAATRVFWKTYTCRLVFHHKVHAEEALEFARENSDLFGNAKVRYYIREVEAADAVESEPIKAQKTDTSAGAPQSRETAVERRGPLNTAVPPHQLLQQQQQQLKSILRKPSGEEVGNGNGRGTSRVKFILGGEESVVKTEQVSSYNEDASSHAHSTDHVTSKNLPNFVHHSIVAPSPNTHQFQKFPSNTDPRPFSATPPTQEIIQNDISQQFLKLLNMCSDVVNNLTGVLGYVPYHPL